MAPWAGVVGRRLRPQVYPLLHGATVFRGLLSSRAPSTTATYAAHWRRWERFCALRNRAGARPLTPWTATPEDVADYLVHLSPHVQIRTVQPYLSCINSAYLDYGLAAVANHRRVKQMRTYLERVQQSREETEHIVPVSAKAMRGLLDNAYRRFANRATPLSLGELRVLRGALAVLVCYLSGSRPLAIQRLEPNNLRVVSSKLVVLTRTESKTAPNSTQFRDAPGRRPVLLHLKDNKLTDLLHIFRARRDSGGHSSRFYFSLHLEDLKGGAFTLWFAAAFELLGEHPPAGSKYTPKSLRHGMATAAYLAGAPMLSIQSLGGWSLGADTVSRVYIRADYVLEPDMLYFFSHLNPQNTQDYTAAAAAARALARRGTAGSF